MIKDTAKRNLGYCVYVYFKVKKIFTKLIITMLLGYSLSVVLALGCHGKSTHDNTTVGEKINKIRSKDTTHKARDGAENKMEDPKKVSEVEKIRKALIAICQKNGILQEVLEMTKTAPASTNNDRKIINIGAWTVDLKDLTFSISSKPRHGVGGEAITIQGCLHPENGSYRAEITNILDKQYPREK